ncbi:PAS domain-containing two-component system sensor histidine kinase [Paenibacillus sp. 32O-W]|uniref:PAS domain S-box protein n=1 Tax=Paenibacillus sp. 32O-W TaxID=1695218 RepID=UPI000721D582|nr:PAS domain S-box protein [Paenibacillus sp. 32O-W]ALS26669.1 PAS domain-containing two-component system sensor histidine kinase [Paenibacillus sp. 32O-W]
MIHVLLSFATAVAASYVSLGMLRRSCGTGPIFRPKIRLSICALSMGFGLWVIHVLEMASGSNEQTAFRWDAAIVLLLVAIAASAVSFALLQGGGAGHAALAGLALGCGCAFMHALDSAVSPHAAAAAYHPWTVASSGAAAILLACAGLLGVWADRSAGHAGGFRLWHSATWLGAALAAMHYAAELAARLASVQAATEAFPPISEDEAGVRLLARTGALLFLMLVLLLAGTLLGRRSDRLRTEQSAMERESLFMHLPDILFSLDGQGKLVDINIAGERMTGYGKSELAGRDFRHLLPPEEWPLYEWYEKRMLLGLKVNFDMPLVGKDGRKGHFNLTAIPVQAGNRRFGCYMIAKDTGPDRQKEEQRRKAEKLAVIANLAAGIAHEIRNPLTTVKGIVQYMLNGSSKPYLYTTMLSEIRQIEGIVTDFLMLASQSSADKRKLDFERLVREAVDNWTDEVKPGYVPVVTKTVEEQVWIEADKTRMLRVIRHLLQEAHEHQEAEEPIAARLIRIDDQTVELAISFSGEADAEERFRQMGEMYYNTKAKGTGYPLMIAYPVIFEHGGELEALSADGRTILRMLLPAWWTEREPAETDAEDLVAAARSGE